MGYFKAINLRYEIVIDKIKHTIDMKRSCHMIEEKFTPFAVFGEETLHHLVDTLYGLASQHSDPVAVCTIENMKNPGENFE
jgi:hypothetical protein